jgi:hypothetical protein
MVSLENKTLELLLRSWILNKILHYRQAPYFKPWAEFFQDDEAGEIFNDLCAYPSIFKGRTFYRHGFLKLFIARVGL